MAIGMSYVEFQMNLEGETLSTGTWNLWAFLNVVLVGTWVPVMRGVNCPNQPAIDYNYNVVILEL